MKKYRLKDRELQETLDAISGGDFSKRLQDPAKSEKGFAVAYGDFPEINGLRHLSLFLADEIEEVPEYDPNKWNPYPEVTPPEYELMRVEFIWNDGSLGRQCAFFEEGVWTYSEDRDSEVENVKRFRPWDDPDEEEDEE